MPEVTRKSFLTALFAPLLARFAPKSHGLTTGETLSMPAPSIALLCELPAPIIDLTTYNDRLFAFTESGLFEVFGDGSYRQCFTEEATPIELADVQAITMTREMSREEFRRRYPAA